MHATRRARKEHRKHPFLKAFSSLGTIIGAAKAARISRDAVYDWLRLDPSFKRAFLNAKHQRQNKAFNEVEATLTLFSGIVRPLVPNTFWPCIATELAIAMSNLKNDLKGGRRKAVPLSGEVAGVSVSLNGSDGVAVSDRDAEIFADDL